MELIWLLMMHRDRMQQLYSENGSWPKVYDELLKLYPNFAKMSLETFELSAAIIMELDKSYMASSQKANLICDNKLNEVKQELERVKQELNKQIELNRQVKLNRKVKQVPVTQSSSNQLHKEVIAGILEMQNMKSKSRNEAQQKVMTDSDTQSVLNKIGQSLGVDVERSKGP